MTSTARPLLRAVELAVLLVWTVIDALARAVVLVVGVRRAAARRRAGATIGDGAPAPCPVTSAAAVPAPPSAVGSSLLV